MSDAEKWIEIGSMGLDEYRGFIQEAYNAQLQWPSVQPLFNKIRRSDPEISVVRHVFTSLARGVSIDWQLPDNANDVDKKAQEFCYQIMNDIDGGMGMFIETMISHVPFFGWGWWETVPGIRSEKWKAPDGDDWRSHYNDGLIGFRRFAWRDTSSFYKWDMNDKTGQLYGMIQQDFPNKQVNIPLNRSIHLTFGDANNPEGLSPLEAVWRLERIKYGLEIVQGIGFEHSAGHLSVEVEGSLNEDDKSTIKRMAKGVMSAQESNYAVWPKDVKGNLVDVPFSSAESILKAIQYFGTLKLMVYNMQWAALSATTGAGSYSAMSDSSSMFMTFYNAMMTGFADQIDQQLGNRIFEYNKGSFKGMSKRPKLIITPIQKTVSLSELGSFLNQIQWMDLDDDDILAIRRYSQVLPEKIPEINDNKKVNKKESNNNDDDDDNNMSVVGPNKRSLINRIRQFVKRPFTVSDDEKTVDVEPMAEITQEDIQDAVNEFRKWAKKNKPKYANILDAKVEDDQ